MGWLENLQVERKRAPMGMHWFGGRLSVGQEAVLSSQSWPTSYVRLLHFHNGLSLFHEQISVFPVGAPGWGAELASFRQIGEITGMPLWLGADGGLYQIDAEEQDPLRVGSDIDHLLDAWIARERLLFGPEGEFRDVFDEEGTLSPAVRRKRIQVGQKKDPGATLYWLEEAEFFYEDGDVEQAQAILRQAVLQDPQAALCLDLLGAFAQQQGQREEAVQHYVRAAEVTLGRRSCAQRWLRAAALQAASNRAQSIQHAWAADPTWAEALFQDIDQQVLSHPEEVEDEYKMWRLLMEQVPAAHASQAATQREGAVNWSLRFRMHDRLRVV